ncbi:MAG: GAF domain-containing protein [Anaerolineales bacterium]|nr:GAF domain-containing protein [Anaerolineales bacterium]
MKRPFYRRPIARRNDARGTSQSQRESGTFQTLDELRERILNVMLYGLLLVGTITLISNLITDIPQGNWGIIIVYVIAFASVLAITFLRRIPFQVRAYGIVVLAYVLGVAAFVQDGIAGNGRVWMLSSAGLAAILLGLNAGIATLVVNSLTLLAIGGMFSLGWLALPDPATMPQAGVFADWISTGSVFLMAAMIVGIALAVLINGLNANLEKERLLSDNLSFDRQQLDDRTHELDRRLVQIRTAAEITRTLGVVLDPNLLLQQVVDLVRQRFNLYYVGAFLLDERAEYAVLSAGTGEAGMKMVSAGHKLPVGGASMIGWTIANRQPRIALDVGKDAVRFSNPLLPKTRSEMALPLLSSDQVFGALSVQSAQPEAFDDDDVAVLQGIADSLATALQNARLFQQAEQNLAEIQALNRQYVADAWKEISLQPAVSQYVYENEGFIGPTEGLKSLNLPITLRDQVIGQLVLETDRAELAPEEVALLEQVTTQAALAMENVRLLEETQRRAGEESLLAGVVQKARSSADIQAILRTALGELGSALSAVEGEISLRPGRQVGEQSGVGGSMPPTGGDGNDGGGKL